MEHIVSRYRNLTVLGLVLFAQVLGLAVQTRRSTPEGGSANLVRVWTAAAITPIERAVVGVEQGFGYAWKTYFDLRSVRVENQGLKLQLDQLRVQQVRLREDAAQAHRLQALLAFKEQFISQTMAAQVIGTSGSEHSKLVYIDKGASDGIRPDMAVITPQGIVGKVIRVFSGTAQVLLINDEQGGIGAILERSRLQGIVRGTPSGTLILHNIMNDEKVTVGEMVLASGGDRVFPKGMPIGQVKTIRNGPDIFFDIEVTPAADLNKLEEVLVITKLVEKSPEVEKAGPMRAADMLADRLPSVPPPAPMGPDGKPLPANNGAVTAAAGNARPAARPNGATTPPSAAAITPRKPVAGATATQPAGATTAPKPLVKPVAPGSTPSQALGAPAGQSTTSNATSGVVTKPAVKKPVAPTADQQQPNSLKKTSPIIDQQSNTQPRKIPLITDEPQNPQPKKTPPAVPPTTEPPRGIRP
jgi:rod shape-determining protein MreC